MALNKTERTARREFTKQYGSETNQVVRSIARGWDSNHIADSLDLSVMTVAAVRANLTRGSYTPFINGTRAVGFEGTCNF